MRENDIIENIRDLYDVKVPNVREKLNFSAVEIVPPPEKKLNRRYVFAGIAYAAACLVVIGLIPFLIGKSGSEPVKPNPGMSAVAVDTSDNTEATDETKENFTERDIVTEEPVVSAEPDVTEEPGSDVVQTEPVIPENDGVTTPVTTPKEPEASSTTTGKKPAVTTKKPAEVTTGILDNPAASEGVGDEYKPGMNYSEGDPQTATTSRVRFFKNSALTEEYGSSADIPYGELVYYIIESDPGYICTSFKVNVYEVFYHYMTQVGSIPQHRNFFYNQYSGDKLEYSVNSVLAGDADGNFKYTLRDAVIVLRYIAGYTTEYWMYGPDGYGACMDFNCNGKIGISDVAGIMKEIAHWNIERENMTDNYETIKGIYSISHLLSIYKPEILPHSKSANVVATNGVCYDVYNDTSSIYRLSDEIKNRYDDAFFESYDLVTIYVWNSDGRTPELGDIKEIWYNKNKGYLTPVYEEHLGGRLSEYAICLTVPKRLKISVNYPV